MSAYVVERHHIIYLVKAALHLSEPDAFYWHYGEGDLIVAPWSIKSQVHIAQVLWDENIHAVAIRYPNSDLPGPIEDDYVITEKDFRRMHWDKFDLPQITKSCECYNYQAMEDPEYENTVAFAFIKRLLSLALNSLPGYKEAVWGAPEPELIRAS